MKLPITEPVAGRSCGDCQACCEVLGVRPNNVPGEPELTRAWERCQFQCDQGCSIYEHRPSPCAAYHCMWRLGWGAEDARPDRLGILTEGSHSGWLFVVECRPGAYAEPLVQAYMEATLNATDTPARGIHVHPWGSEDVQCGYWDSRGEVPTKSQLLAEALLNGWHEFNKEAS